MGPIHEWLFKLFKHDCGLGLVQIHFKIGVGHGILIHFEHPICLQIAQSSESGMLVETTSPPNRSFSVRRVSYGYRDTSFGLGLAHFGGICLPFGWYSAIRE